MASADEVRVTGRGGHGAAPHATIDPVVVCASIVMALQTVVSCNVNPQERAIVTTGSIHAGTASNVIPPHADLELSVRALSPAVRALLGMDDWQAGYVPSLGYGRVDPSCRGFSEDERTMTADERSEEADWKAATKRAEQVDVCVDALTWQECAAIQRHRKAKRTGALNEACGAKVWSNPRGFDLSDGHANYQGAKEALYPRPKQRGLLAQAVCA